jgi:hypothetical protein
MHSNRESVLQLESFAQHTLYGEYAQPFCDPLTIVASLTFGDIMWCSCRKARLPKGKAAERQDRCPAGETLVLPPV